MTTHLQEKPNSILIYKKEDNDSLSIIQSSQTPSHSLSSTSIIILLSFILDMSIRDGNTNINIKTFLDTIYSHVTDSFKKDDRFQDMELYIEDIHVEYLLDESVIAVTLGGEAYYSSDPDNVSLLLQQSFINTSELIHQFNDLPITDITFSFFIPEELI